MKDLYEYLSDLEILTDEIGSEFSNLDTEQINWKPSPKKWSVGQCLEHLIVTSQSYQSTFGSILSGAYTPSLWARISPFSNFLGNYMVKTLGPENRRAYKTSKVFEPRSSSLEPAVVERLISQNILLKETFENLIELNSQELVVTSPESSMITYKIKHTIALIIRHQQRHIAQAREVLVLNKILSNI